MTELTIPRDVVEQIRRQALTEAPNEACGYLLGHDTRVTGLIEMTNVDASPEHFSLDPAEQFAALKQAREREERLLAVYHSHPETPARMSAEDIRLANDPGAIYVIHSLADGRTRGFRVDREKQVTDVRIHIDESPSVSNEP